MAWRRLSRLNLFRATSSSSINYLFSSTSPEVNRISSLCASLSPQFPKFTGFSGYSHYLRDDRRWYSINQSHAETVVPVTGGELVEVPLAQTGEGIAECELLKWFVQEGDEVEEFERLCGVQSDKATIEITSRIKGKINQINFTPGDIVKVGETLLKILADGHESNSSDRTSPVGTGTIGTDGENQSETPSVTGGVLAIYPKIKISTFLFTN